MNTNKITKEEYLRKKGLIPVSHIYTFKSTREGVDEIIKQGIWEIRELTKTTRYKLRESPFEVDFKTGQDISENSGYGSGFGDLWGWSYFSSLDLEKLKVKHQEEKKRVEDKYGNGNKEETFLMPSAQ